MDHNDRQAIEGLFGNLAEAGRAQPHRDAEAEALIGELIARNPGAAYYLAQTVLVQEQALNAAQARMEQLEHQAQAAQQQGGGFLGRLFGAPQPQLQPRPQSQPRPLAAAPGPAQAGPWGGGRAGGGGGFLAGAAQTAMGVAGGVLLGNAIAGMFDSPAQAGEPMAEDAGFDEEPGFDDGGFDAGDE